MASVAGSGCKYGREASHCGLTNTNSVRAGRGGNSGVSAGAGERTSSEQPMDPNWFASAAATVASSTQYRQCDPLYCNRAQGACGAVYALPSRPKPLGRAIVASPARSGLRRSCSRSVDLILAANNAALASRPATSSDLLATLRHVTAASRSRNLDRPVRGTRATAVGR